MNKKSFVLFTDVYESIQELPKMQKADLLDAIYTYAISGKEIPLKPEARMAFSFIKREINRNHKKWKEIKKVRKEAGRKGGLKTQAKSRLLSSKSSKNKQAQANQAVTVTGTVITTSRDVVSKDYKNRLTNLLGESHYKFENNKHYYESSAGWQEINSPAAFIKSLEKKQPEKQHLIDGTTFDYEKQIVKGKVS